MLAISWKKLVFLMPISSSKIILIPDFGMILKLFSCEMELENDVLFKVTQAYSEKGNPRESSYQESNLRPSDY